MLFKNIGIIDENFKYQPDMTVGVQADRITYIGKTAPENVEAFGEIYNGKNKVLIPGFYNAHGHSPMSLMRGYGENMTLHDWLNKKIFPFESKLYSKAVYWGTLLSMAESLRFGIISTSDMYYFTGDMVEAYSAAGAKTNICRSVANPEGLEISELVGLKEMREAITMYDGIENGRIKVDASIHAEYTTDEKTMRAVAEAAGEFNVNIQVHLDETKFEADNCREKYGMSTTEVFEKFGVFNQPCTAAHCVWVSESDMDILKAKGVTVASNPTSNFKLASGICDVPKMYEKGVNVALGTDSVASNNSLNFIEQIKLFAIAGKVKAMDPAVMTPEQVLYSATRAGALSQGREDCGLLKENFKADLIVIDAGTPNMQPVHDMANNIIYSADGKDVCLTMVDGRICYQDGEYKTIDIEETIAEAEKARAKIVSGL
ncbi:MAG: amidohydrolase [Mogibacterium sp.]|nr:amidohydrolase [Mogibacterium sp.]